MKTLVAYYTQTGNTKKVAEAIYEEISGEKDIKPVGELDDLEGYDLVFLGFPIQAGNPAREARDFLLAKGAGKRIALFITHGAPENAARLGPWLQKARDLVDEAGAELLGIFDCQGEVSQEVVTSLLSSEDSETREYGREALEARGMPCEAGLEQARRFAREMMAKA